MITHSFKPLWVTVKWRLFRINQPVSSVIVLPSVSAPILLPLPVVPRSVLSASAPSSFISSRISSAVVVLPWVFPFSAWLSLLFLQNNHFHNPKLFNSYSSGLFFEAIIIWSASFGRGRSIVPLVWILFYWFFYSIVFSNLYPMCSFWRRTERNRHGFACRRWARCPSWSTPARMPLAGNSLWYRCYYRVPKSPFRAIWLKRHEACKMYNSIRHFKIMIANQISRELNKPLLTWIHEFVRICLLEWKLCWKDMHKNRCLFYSKNYLHHRTRWMHTAGKPWYDGHGLSKTMIIRGNIVFLKFEEKLGRNRKDEFLDESSSDFYGHDFLTSKCLLSVPKGV